MMDVFKNERVPWWGVLLFALVFGILGWVIGSDPVRHPPAGHRVIAYFGNATNDQGEQCTFAATWAGQYLSSPPHPCGPEVMEVIEAWIPVMLPDGRQLKPPKSKEQLRRVPDGWKVGP